MSSLADILNSGRNAVRVQQLAMLVVGQNTANVNTGGYTRRRVDVATAPEGSAARVALLEKAEAPASAMRRGCG